LAGTLRGTALAALAPEVAGHVPIHLRIHRRPKGVCGSEDLLDRAEAEIEWFGLSERDVLKRFCRFRSTSGLNQLFASLVAGATLVILDSWMPADIMPPSAERGVDRDFGSARIWLDFLKAGLHFDLTGIHRSLRYITVSAATSALRISSPASLGEAADFPRRTARPRSFGPLACGPRSSERICAAVDGRSMLEVYACERTAISAEPGERGEIVATDSGHAWVPGRRR
jgi:hypothetical protein